MLNLPLIVIRVWFDADGNGSWVADLYNRQTAKAKELASGIDRAEVEAVAADYATFLNLPIVR